MTTAVHSPNRPHWDCRACGLEWPCEQVKTDLVNALDPRPRAMYAASRFVEAIHDLSDVDPAAIFARIFFWTTPRGADRDA
ncbi:flavin reductase [Micromonospora sp. CPCC 206060]|uniref:flavin reductase n=1 Tax=Micromonospora sp. CPCC 206060 TaxID=3122406 RepID=UPI002FF00537